MVTSFGRVEAPFSVLIATPETRPLWTSVPERFLTSEIGPHVRFMNEAYQSERHVKRGEGRTDPEISGLSEFGEIAKLGQAAFMEGVIERVSTDCLTFPFPPTLVDRWVSLSTPAVGLATALQRLTQREQDRLWDALATERKLMVENGIRSSGVPAFLWQVAHKETDRLFAMNPWLADIPMVHIRCQQHENPPLHGLCRGAQMITKVCEDNFFIRLRMMGNSKSFMLSEGLAQPLEKFLHEGFAWQREQRDESSGIRVDPTRWTNLAMKLALLEVAVSASEEIGRNHIEFGVELAKRFSVKHLEAMSAVEHPVCSQRPDTTDMTARERDVFLRICERGEISPSDLSRSFSCLRATERDEIIANLISRDLVTLEDGLLRRSAA